MYIFVFRMCVSIQVHVNNALIHQDMPHYITDIVIYKHSILYIFTYSKVGRMLAVHFRSLGYCFVSSLYIR